MGMESDKYVTFVLKRIEGLVSFGVKVLMVFDGGPLPSKEGTEVSRAASRNEARENAKRLQSEGNLEGARQCFVKSVDVSPAMAARVIAAMKERYGSSRVEVDWLVAPYEADAQLAYLAKQGIVDAVVSEDSDMIAYGVARTLFKWDGSCGDQIFHAHVLGMKAESAAAATGSGGKKGGAASKVLDMTGFDEDMVLYMCVLAGCDYLPSVKGVSVKGAHKIVARHKEPKRILRALRFQFDSKVPQEYEERFEKACRTFRHQRVFDPRTRTVVPLTPFPASLVAEVQRKKQSSSSLTPKAASSSSSSSSVSASASEKTSAKTSRRDECDGVEEVDEDVEDGEEDGAGSGGKADDDGKRDSGAKQHDDGDGDDPLSYLGREMASEVGSGIADGRLDPVTFQPFPAHAAYLGTARPPQQQRQSASASSHKSTPNQHAAGAGWSGSKRASSLPSAAAAAAAAAASSLSSDDRRPQSGIKNFFGAATSSISAAKKSLSAPLTNNHTPSPSASSSSTTSATTTLSTAAAATSSSSSSSTAEVVEGGATTTKDDDDDEGAEKKSKHFGLLQRSASSAMSQTLTTPSSSSLSCSGGGKKRLKSIARLRAANVGGTGIAKFLLKTPLPNSSSSSSSSSSNVRPSSSSFSLSSFAKRKFTPPQQQQYGKENNLGDQTDGDGGSSASIGESAAGISALDRFSFNAGAGKSNGEDAAAVCIDLTSSSSSPPPLPPPPRTSSSSSSASSKLGRKTRKPANALKKTPGASSLLTSNFLSGFRSSGKSHKDKNKKSGTVLGGGCGTAVQPAVTYSVPSSSCSSSSSSSPSLSPVHSTTSSPSSVGASGGHGGGYDSSLSPPVSAELGNDSKKKRSRHDSDGGGGGGGDGGVVPLVANTPKNMSTVQEELNLNEVGEEEEEEEDNHVDDTTEGAQGSAGKRVTTSTTVSSSLGLPMGKDSSCSDSSDIFRQFAFSAVNDGEICI